MIVNILHGRKEVSTMLLYWELSDKDRTYHFEVAKNLVVGNAYTFRPAIQVTPLVNWPNRAEGSPKSLLVTVGEFVRWRVEGRFKDCLFLVQTDPWLPVLSRFEYLVPILFTRGTEVTQV